MPVRLTSPALKGGLLALLAAALFGLSTPLVQRLGVGLGAFSTAALLYGGAALVGAFSRRPKEQEARVQRSDTVRLLAMAFFGVVIGPVALAWGMQRTSGREVKALAQRHVAELEEKRREIDQMMEGFSVLVKACHGDDQPHCAILEQLSQGSSTQYQPQHKPKLKKSQARPDDPGASASNHIDLMAWMHGVPSHRSAH